MSLDAHIRSKGCKNGAWHAIAAVGYRKKTPTRTQPDQVRWTLTCKTGHVSRDVHLHSHPSRVEHWRHVIEIAAFIIAAAWGVYIFVYQERVKPETVPPHLQATVFMEDHPLRNGRLFVKVRMLIKNDRESTASVAGLYMNASGQRYGSKEARYLTYPASGIIESGDAMVAEPEHLVSAFVAEWHAFGSDKYLKLPSGGTFEESVGFVIDRQRYDTIKLRWRLCWSHPTTHVHDPKLKRNADGSYTFADTSAESDLPGFSCFGVRRGDPFPL